MGKKKEAKEAKALGSSIKSFLAANLFKIRRVQLIKIWGKIVLTKLGYRGRNERLVVNHVVQIPLH